MNPSLQQSFFITEKGTRTIGRGRTTSATHPAGLNILNIILSLLSLNKNKQMSWDVTVQAYAT
jgi:hypothetical protein